MPVALPNLKKIKQLEGKIVLVRIDANVPIEKKKVMDDSRLLAALATIQYLREKKARIVLISHLGRPEGKKKAALSLAPVSLRLGKLLGTNVKQLLDYKGPSVEQSIARMKPGSIVMLENIRFAKEEEGNLGALGEYLASLGDLFVLDGFSVAHRADASVVGIAPHLPSYAGFLLQKEVKGLEYIMESTKRPAVLVLGGAKSETKIPIIKNFLNRADHILIGGSLFNTYLGALGYGIGDSLCDSLFFSEAKKYIKHEHVIKPIDVIVGTKNGKMYRHVALKKNKQLICAPGEAILDIGPQTIALFAKYVKGAKTVVWNGAMGYFEQHPYDTGTKAIARLIAIQSKGKAYGVIGGGETLQVMDQVGMMDLMDLASTGGGAMLEYLSGKKLPGIEALLK